MAKFFLQLFNKLIKKSCQADGQKKTIDAKSSSNIVLDMAKKLRLSSPS